MTDQIQIRKHRQDYVDAYGRVVVWASYEIVYADGRVLAKSMCRSDAERWVRTFARELAAGWIPETA
jgi:hypothetical protein